MGPDTVIREAAKLLGQARPAQKEGFGTRTTRVVVKTAAISSLLTVIFLFSAFFSAAFSYIKPVLGLLGDSSAYQTAWDSKVKKDIRYATDPTADHADPKPIGQIEILERSGCTLRIRGYTNNVPEGHYIVLAADREDLRLTWPKQPIIQPNTAFTVRIHEPDLEQMVSIGLYAVAGREFREVKAWLDNRYFGRMQILPGRCLVAEVGEGQMVLMRTKR
ncbi:MAG: hypothetical protein ACOWWM_20890 [Desulfobacterales bacterium]